MSTLAGHAFVKMNGLGNEIVVVDMRATPAPIAAEDARAAAQPAGAPYDQMMALYPPRTPGTDAYVRIYNSDGSPAGAEDRFASWQERQALVRLDEYQELEQRYAAPTDDA